MFETIQHFSLSIGKGPSRSRMARFSRDGNYMAGFFIQQPAVVFSMRDGYPYDLDIPYPMVDIAFGGDITGAGNANQVITEVAIALGAKHNLVHRRFLVDHNNTRMFHKVRGISFPDACSLAYSPDGKFLACGNGKGLVGVYELDGERDREVVFTNVTSHRISRLSLTVDNKKLFVVTGDGKVHVVDVETGDICSEFSPNGLFDSSEIYSVAAYPRYTYAPATNGYRSYNDRSPAEHNVIKPYNYQGTPISVMAFAGESPLLWLLLLVDEKISRCDEHHRFYCFEHRLGSRVTDLCFFPDGRLAMVGTCGAAIYNMSPLTSHHVITRDHLDDAAVGVGMSQEDKSLLVAWASGKVAAA